MIAQSVGLPGQPPARPRKALVGRGVRGSIASNGRSPVTAGAQSSPRRVRRCADDESTAGTATGGPHGATLDPSDLHCRLDRFSRVGGLDRGCAGLSRNSES